MNPSDFTEYPWSSVLGNSESETVACNIMVILKRTGDTWRDLTWDEYEKERKKDGNFSNMEKSYFNKVRPYTISSDSAYKFSPVWAKVKDNQLSN